MNRTLGDMLTPALILVSFEFASVEHLRDTPARESQDPGSLRRRVDIFIHVSAVACYCRQRRSFRLGSRCASSQDSRALLSFLPSSRLQANPVKQGQVLEPSEGSSETKQAAPKRSV
jgi:hypothetical protein